MRAGAMQGLRFDRRTLRDLQGRESVVVERVNVKPENPAAGLRVGAALAPLMFFTLSACAGRLSLDPVAPRAFESANPPAQLETDVAQSAEAPVRTSKIEPLQSAPNATPSAPSAPSRISVREATDADIAAMVNEDRLTARFPPQPVAQFIDTAFGQFLDVPYVTGPEIADSRQIVSLRGNVDTTKRAFFSMVQTALRDYGIAVLIENGVVRLVKDAFLASQAPQLIRTRTLPETAEPWRAVVQFFELRSVEASALEGLLQDTFPQFDKVKIKVRPDINTMVLTGPARDVAEMAQLIEQVDQPRFANGQVVRIEPAYWAAEALAAAVSQALATEGFQATTIRGGGAQRAVTFMAIPFTNQLLLFSNIPEAFDRAIYWLRELDRPAALGNTESVFVYTVQNTSAEDLGELVARVRAGGGAPPPRVQTGAANQTPVGATTGGAGVAAAPRAQNQAEFGVGGGGQITVDVSGNRLLFRGTASDYEQVRKLFEELDTPPLQVQVEITIAEVTLTDNTTFGIEWFFDEAIENGFIVGGTEGGLGLSEGGLTLDFDHSFVRATLSAVATNNNVNILSTPRIVARSGGEGRIQVGTDVPIITSQRAADTQLGGTTDILQNVQFRQTGVVLTVRPIVFGDRVQLDLFQEVSSDAPNPNAAIGNPLILTRSIAIQISLREGTTAVIGGLVQENYTRGTTGVPFLKDIPVLGAAFRTDSVDNVQTELLVLITPYIVKDGDELARAAEYYAERLNTALRKRGPHAYTLYPWRTPLDLAGPQHTTPPEAISGARPAAAGNESTPYRKD